MDFTNPRVTVWCYQYLLLHLREPARADRLKFFAIATPSTNPHMDLASLRATCFCQKLRRIWQCQSVAFGDESII